MSNRLRRKSGATEKDGGLPARTSRGYRGSSASELDAHSRPATLRIEFVLVLVGSRDLA